MGRRVTRALASVPPDERVALVNALLAGLDGDVIEDGPQQLLSVARQEQPGVWTLLGTRPAVPLSRPALLTNSTSDPKLGAELRAELATADRVDLLCAFVKWYGLRVLEDQLLARRQRGVPLRVLTTTYMGATDRTALDRLVRDFGAEVKVNYETQSTRLHAKAWLFRRHSGYDTAYVGSSNLSRAALLDGLEWNVKLAGSHTPELTAKFEATFDTYWADPAFVTYDPDQDRERLDRALAVAGGLQERGTVTRTVSGLEVRPYPHQEAILDRLQVERETHGHHRNLVVAATGTGKTVIAALDYARMPGRPVPPVRRPPQGDPRAVAQDLPGGPGRRGVRRAVRRRRGTRAVEARLRQRAEPVRRRAAAPGGGPVRRRRGRRVPPRRGHHLPAAARAPASRRSCSG